MHLSPKKLFRLLYTFFCFIIPLSQAVAIGGEMGMYSRGGGGHDMAVSIPIIAPESTGSFELNLKGIGSLALEGSYKGETELLDNKEREESPNSSLISREHQWRLLFSRYSNPATMSGLFWTLGAGYRTADIRWQKTMEPIDAEIQGAYLDDNNTIYHEGRLSGVTGHIRLGYRYVGESIPFVVGGYIGIRHFQSGVKDSKPEDTTIAPLSDTERKNLQRRYMTSFEPALSVGWAF